MISLSFDPAGNFHYATSSGGGRPSTLNSIYKIPAGQSTPVFLVQVANSSSKLQSLAIDAASNIFSGALPLRLLAERAQTHADFPARSKAISTLARQKPSIRSRS